MHSWKIYVDRDDCKKIGDELITIVEDLVKQVHNSQEISMNGEMQSILSKKELEKKVMEYTLKCYFDCVENIYCKGFINYYDIQNFENYGECLSLGNPIDSIPIEARLREKEKKMNQRVDSKLAAAYGEFKGLR